MTEHSEIAHSLLNECFNLVTADEYERQMLGVENEFSAGQPVITPSLLMERRVDALVRDLDELVALAANPETVHLVEEQKVSIGQIICRAELVGSFLLSRHPTKAFRR